VKTSPPTAMRPVFGLVMLLMFIAVMIEGCATPPPQPIKPPSPSTTASKLPMVELVMPPKLQNLRVSRRSLLVGLGSQPIQADLGRDVLALLKKELRSHFSEVLVHHNRMTEDSVGVVVESLEGEIAPNDLSFEIRVRISLHDPVTRAIEQREMVGRGTGNAAKLWWAGALAARGVVARSEQAALNEICGQFEQIIGRLRAPSPPAASMQAAKSHGLASSSAASSPPGRPRLGIRIQPLTPQLARAFGYPGSSGVLVAQLDEKGAAALAGVKRGDIILAFEGHSVHSPAELVNLVRSLPPDATVAVTLWRSGERLAITIPFDAKKQEKAKALQSASGEDKSTSRKEAKPGQSNQQSSPSSLPSPQGKQAALTFYRQGMEAVQRAENITDLQKAAAAFSRAVEAAPEWPVARYNFARVLVELDRPYGAIKAYRKYLELAPHATKRARVLAQIDRLETLRATKKRVNLPGVTFAAMKDGIYVLHLLPGVRVGNINFMRQRLGPRASALQRGDKIVEVNAQSVAGLSLDEFFRIIDQGIRQETLQKSKDLRSSALLSRLVTNRPALKDVMVFMKVVRGGRNRFVICSKEVFHSRLVNVEAEELKDTLLQGKGKVVAFFWANWCRPCAKYTPTVEKMSESFGDSAAFLSVNIEEDKDGVRAFGVDRIPTLVVYERGVERDRLTGQRTQDDVFGFLAQHLR